MDSFERRYEKTRKMVMSEVDSALARMDIASLLVRIPVRAKEYLEDEIDS